MGCCVVQGSAEAELCQDAATGAAAASVSRWHGAAAIVRVAVRLGRSTGKEPLEDAAAAAADAASKRCYVIPEDAAPGEGPERASDGADKGAAVLPQWRSPLSCAPVELPEGARLRGQVLEMGAAPDMKSCDGTWSSALPGEESGVLGGTTAGEAVQPEETAKQAPHTTVDVYDTAGSRTIELVDAAAKVDIEVVAVDSNGAAEATCPAERRADDSGSASCSSSAFGALRESSAQVGKTDSVAQGVSPITNSEGGSTLSATGGGLSLSPVAPAGGTVMVEAPAATDRRDGGAAGGEATGDAAGGGGGGGAVYVRSIDNQLFLSDTARLAYLHACGEGPPPQPQQAPGSPPAKGIGRGRGDAAARVELVDTDAVVLQMGGSEDGYQAAVATGAFGSFGSTGAGMGGSSMHQELSLMDVDPLSNNSTGNNSTGGGGLPPRPPSGAAAVGGMPTAQAYLLGRSPSKCGGVNASVLPCPLSIGRASDDDSMHLTTGSAWSYGDAGAAQSDAGDEDSGSPRRVAGIGPNGLPILGWNQIPNQEPERVRGAIRGARPGRARQSGCGARRPT